MNRETQTRPAALVPVLAVGLLSFASSSILVRLAGDEAPPATVLALRTLFAAALLAPFGARALTRERHALAGRKALLLAGAAVLLILHFGLWIAGVYLTSVASATVLVNTTPLFLAAAALFVFRERTPRRTLVAVALGFGGAVLIGVGDAGGRGSGSDPLVGNVLSLAAALAMAGYLTVGGRLRQGLSWSAYVMPLYALVAAGAVAAALATGAPLLGLSGQTYLLCLGMALGPQLLGHGSINFALRYVSPVLLSLLALLEPVGASLLAWGLFGEVPPPLALGGMALTLGGVALALTRSTPPETAG